MPPEKVKFLLTLTNTTEPHNQLEAVSDLLEVATKEYMDQLLELAPTDLVAYSEYMHPDEPPADWHYFLMQKLMKLAHREIPRLMISAPPGHAKSTYASRDFPTWLMGKQAKTKYIQAGHSQLFVESEFGKKCRDIIESDRYHEVFPNILLSNASRAAGNWVISNSSTYLARGVGQGISGFRSNIAGIDDPFASREDAESQLIRDKVYAWYKADFLTRLLPRCPLFIVATRWHSDDLCGRLEAENELILQGLRDGIPWEIINLPAIYTDESIQDPLGRKRGEALWPEFYDYEVLMTMMAEQSSKDWNSLYMGKPIDEQGGVIKREWFADTRYRVPPKRELVKRRTMSVDTANKDTERSAYTVATIWDETQDGHHYLLRTIRKRLEFTGLCSMIKRVGEAFDVDAILVEDKGSGTQFLQTQRNPPTQITTIPVISISVDQKSKEFRMDGVSPFMEAGIVHLPETARWLAEYEAELFGWPNTKYRDQGDSTSQYLSWVKPKRQFGAKRAIGTGYGTKNRAAIEEIQARVHELTNQQREDNPVIQRNYVGTPNQNKVGGLERIKRDIAWRKNGGHSGFLLNVDAPRKRYGARRIH